MANFASSMPHTYEGIITCDNNVENILRTPTPVLKEEDWDLAHATIKKLRAILQNIGGAGLAAPQIGILLPIFIYTPNRTAEGLIDVINPSYEPLGTMIVEGYEACYSEPLRCTKLTRWKTIKCRYQNLEGQWQDVVLQDFPAKVFQHEMDHLQGKLTMDHPSAQVTTFPNEQDFQEHLDQIRQNDSRTYKAN